MRISLALIALVGATVAGAQIDDITQRMMFGRVGNASAAPQWGTLMVGSEAGFRLPGTYVIDSYDQWCNTWPMVAGNFYDRNVAVPTLIDWGREQIVLISLGDLGAQGYGIYVEDVRRSSSFGFDVSYVITQPSLQINASLSYGSGTSPFVALRVPRGMGFPNFYSRWYTPSRTVWNRGCCCGHCHTHNNQIWWFSRGVLTPYVPPARQQQDVKDGN